MSRRGFNPARRTGTTVPRVQSMVYATGQTFKDGALVVKNANGEIVECGADPAAVEGVALAAVGTGYGYGLPNSDVTNVVTGRLQELPVAIADGEQEFSARAINGATDPVLPLQTHIGEQYGVAKVGDDWVIDMAEVTTKVIEITDTMPETNRFLCKFLATVRGRP
jgi:hypothetical protein